MDLIYRGRKINTVGLFGLGKSNLGVLRYLSKHYPTLHITLRADGATLPRGIHPSRFDRMRIGRDAYTSVEEDLLFLSPTVRQDSLIGAERERLTSDAEFYFDNTDQLVFAITGSDGKSTTTTLAALMLSRGKERVSAIGNIGVAMTPKLDSRMRYAVAELSSFQLMSIKPRTQRALITNISENHLDFHRNMQEYVAAKTNILENASERVLNYNSPLARIQYEGYPIYGVYSLTESEDVLRQSVKAELYVTLADGVIIANGEPILDVKMLKTASRHNIENFMAAIALTYVYTDKEQIRRVGSAFSGIAHRCEYIGTFSGVKYINSSIDSTPTRTSTTLTSLSERVIVILGGKNKGLDYRALLPALRSSAKHVIITGAAKDDIAAALLTDDAFGPLGIPFEIHGEFCDAVLAAIRAARDGDTVILSPASTSFDAHKSFEDRGEKFKQIIRNYYYKGT
ncbi:MAG: UDP-N-acetylmuramoyl-L-alanine--D-glutamate ligase [Clostridia bacterium]|nr:UDP-N-acetylmuramoyl-L-alanine--D-glutamate ligase [Clostridia bacterium]